jgi:hypothetical protein
MIENAYSLKLHTILPRLPPASWAVLPSVSGQSFPIRPADALAVVACWVEPCGAVAAGFLDDDLVWVRLDGLAVIPRAVGASGARVALAGDGGLG